MGYSARYHMASLAAVFLALAIGILIGSEFGDEIVSDTRDNLENSLTGNLEDAQDRADDLSRDLELSDAFGERVYPTLVGDRLADRSIGILALGDISGDLAAEIEGALEPTGGSLIAVGVIREPPDLSELAIDLEDTRFSDVEENLDTVQALGTGVGRQLAIGGTLLDVVQPDLFSRASGTFGDLDGVIVVRDQPSDLEDEDDGGDQPPRGRPDRRPAGDRGDRRRRGDERGGRLLGSVLPERRASRTSTTSTWSPAASRWSSACSARAAASASRRPRTACCPTCSRR